jgi:Lon protease-like protein
VTREIPLFPLRTVLFPDGLLPLKIFEQRYLDMTKACIRDGSAFGVCLIREGGEVGEPALPHPVGCTARIVEWDMPHLGIFQLLCRGETVFRIMQHWSGSNGLVSAVVEEREMAPRMSLPAEFEELGKLLRRIIDTVGAESFPAPILLDDAHWVSCRLSEALPLDPEIKQRLLEAGDVHERLAQLQALLKDKSVQIGKP